MRIKFIPIVLLVLLPWKLLGAVACHPDQVDFLLAKKLGWIIDIHADNICKGFYREIPIPRITKLFRSGPKNDEDDYYLEADHVTYSVKGTSILKGHVRAVHQDREITSDMAHVYLDSKTGKMRSIDTKGSVRFMEPGKLLLADRGHIDLVTKVVNLKNVIYRIVFDKEKSEKIKIPGEVTHRLYRFGAWGTARKAKKTPPDIIDLEKATYTYCPPISCVWMIKANKIRLNSETGRGYAVHTQLRVKDIPIFYFPYFNFPIDKRRQSGFLVPSYHFSSHSGASLMVPYYWNIAPNYDMTILPDFITKRGVSLNGLFRYLTSKSQGSIQVGFIPFDFEFKQFKKEAISRYAGRPTLDQLKNADNTRYALSIRHHTRFNQYWSGDIHYNGISDDYYLQDFRKSSIDNSGNQLLQQVHLDYFNRHWHFLANLQNYQTLHPVNKIDAENQYARLPQLRIDGNLPDRVVGLNYTLSGEAVYFVKKRNPDELIDPVTGIRLSLRPTMSWPINWSFGHIEPRAQVQMTQYQVDHVLGDDPKAPNVAVPLFDIKGELYFDRNIQWLNKKYNQTLEPVVYYLYVPYRDQDRLPYFDTTEKMFNYDVMFQDNRFSGIDRIGDANQIALGVTSRFISLKNGDEKAKASIGQAYYFRKHRVSLCPDNNCQFNKENLANYSPLTALATYYVSSDWNAQAGFSWDPHTSNFDNQNIKLQYLPDQNHIFNIGYNFIQNGGLNEISAYDKKSDLKQTNISGYWKINNYWSLLGRWNYNWGYEHFQTYFYGITYESCCWAVRLISARTYVGLDDDDKSKFDNAIYIQFSLKGLGNVGSSDPKMLLSQSINGYIDNFGKEGFVQ